MCLTPVKQISRATRPQQIFLGIFLEFCVAFYHVITSLISNFQNGLTGYNWVKFLSNLNFGPK